MVKNLSVLLGKDYNSKKAKTEKIKEALSQKGASFSPVIFFSTELELLSLQKEISNLSFTKRLFIFNHSESLSEEIKSYLIKFLEGSESKDYFLFDFDLEMSRRENLQRDKFFSLLCSISPAYKIGGREVSLSLNDLAFALRRNSLKQALLIIDGLFKRYGKDKISLPVLGLLIKMFSSFKGPLRAKRIKALLETDRMIKEGILPSQPALEFLLLRLAHNKD